MLISNGFPEQPEELGVSFGIERPAELANLVVARGGSKSNFNVSLRWRNKEKDKDKDKENDKKEKKTE